MMRKSFLYLVSVIVTTLTITYSMFFYERGKMMSNKDRNNWFKLLSKDENLLQWNSTGSYKRNLEKILDLSIKMMKSGMTTLEELSTMGDYFPFYPKSGPPSDFNFHTQYIHTTVTVNLKTEKIQRVSILSQNDIDINNINIEDITFVKNEFLVHEGNNLGTIYHSYHIKQKYHLKNNPDIIIEFWKDYDNDEKESFEYFKGHLDELHLFSDVVLYRQSEIKQ